MENTMKQYEVLKWASLFLIEHNREEKVAELLLQHYLGVSRSAFFAAMREPIPETVIKQFKEAIMEHAETGVPVQHLIGYEFFYGRRFQVNQHTLIPRPETEELVQHVIKIRNRKFSKDEPITIVDVGTGSGIIACTLALELENAHVYATDISDDALITAKKNAEQLGANVMFTQGDFLQPIIDSQIKADIIISNPPYISRDDEAELPDTVKLFDPEIALFAEENGLAAYKKIIEQLPRVMKDQAAIAFEIGYQQGEAVQNILLKKFPVCSTAIIKDINGKDRIVAAEIDLNEVVS